MIERVCITVYVCVNVWRHVCTSMPCVHVYTVYDSDEMVQIIFDCEKNNVFVYIFVYFI